MSRKIKSTVRDFYNIRKSIIGIFDSETAPPETVFRIVKLNRCCNMCATIAYESANIPLVDVITPIPTQRIFDMLAHLSTQHDIIVECKLIGFNHDTVKDCNLTYQFRTHDCRLHKLVKHLVMLSEEHMSPLKNMKTGTVICPHADNCSIICPDLDTGRSTHVRPYCKHATPHVETAECSSRHIDKHPDHRCVSRDINGCVEYKQ